MLLIKLCLILVVAAGVSSAVTVPLVLNFQGKGAKATGSFRSGQPVKLTSLNMCNPAIKDSSISVNYGEPDNKDICGELESSDLQSTTSEHRDKFSSLIKEVWEEQYETWSNKSYGEWKDECSVSDPKWTVFSSGSDAEQVAEEEYLGLCNSNQVTNTPFLKRTRDNNSLTLKICTNQCGTILSGIGDGNPLPKIELQEANEDSFKTVKFFRQKVN